MQFSVQTQCEARPPGLLGPWAPGALRMMEQGGGNLGPGVSDPDSDPSSATRCPNPVQFCADSPLSASVSIPDR